MDYWILPSKGVGGSEVRLINNWLFSRERFPHESKLVLSPVLYDLLKAREHFAASIEKWNGDIIKVDFPDNFRTIQEFYPRLLETTLADAGSVYFLLHFPLLSKKKKNQRFIYIHPGTTIFSNSNIKGLIGQFANVFKADIVDVLDPRVLKIFRSLFFYKKRAIQFTEFGISENTLKLTDRIRYEAKKTELVFIGTFIHLKQIIQLLASVQAVHSLLVDYGLKPQFNIIGKGPLEGEVKKRVEHLNSTGVCIDHIVTMNPTEYLLRAKVIFSVQKHNNYPSQALFEGLLCGCLPVVTDTGNTIDIARPWFSSYVKENFTPDEIAGACSQILLLSDEEYQERSRAAIHHIKKSFSTVRMAQYYLSLSAAGAAFLSDQNAEKSTVTGNM